MKKKLIFLIFSVYLISGCGEEHAETRQVFTQDDVAVELAKDVEILYSDSAVVRVRVSGATMLNFTSLETPKQEFPDGIRFEFLLPDGSVRSTLTAHHAIRQQDKGTIVARDSVVMNTVKQERLETEELIWDEKAGKIRTDKFVKVSQPGEVVYGFGLEAEQDFSYWKILVPKGKIKAEQMNDLNN
ncbi:MAG: LPS export ABC transporter periplasmic protein LptC [Bacteroidota bacterium]|nr:LPS export ABC transporter periplasmic protein LptC [Saprospiraceae bacterium]